MDISFLIDGLNDKQRQAVTAPLGNYLILAGAGSGKTRVLTQRIAWLIEVENISESQILAVTFTNKASREMRNRIQNNLTNPHNLNHMWVGTFHSIALRILRIYFQEASLPKDFQVLDSDDQNRMIKRILKTHGFNEKLFTPQNACWFINHHKEECQRLSHIFANNEIEQGLINIYQLYQSACERSGLVDFAEILLRCYELLQNNPLILQHFQYRFKQILVDEFQDTSLIQYNWIKLLAGKHNNVMIVGDDDQSIYGWRGARIENIQHFSQDFPAVETIRLEQNYRSKGNILHSANHLITHNEDRLGKELWTADDNGETVGIYSAFNELDEALYVVSEIEKWHQNGGDLNQCAILYRHNSQSLNFEKALNNANIPYRIYGGLRFFERQEIKDALAYLRLIANSQDDSAFERIINTPARSIGTRTMDILRELAKEHSSTLWEALHTALQKHIFPNRAGTALLRFVELLQYLEREITDLPLWKQIDFIIHHSGLYEMYQNEKGDKGEIRIENIEELVNYAKDFQNEEPETSDLTAFLSAVCLDAGESSASTQDCVQLMTLHNAKGLEFDRVFIVGMEEGIFPSKLAEEENRMNEERRLAYVGITRAKKLLTLCYAEIRSLYGKTEPRRPSRFLNELPNQCISEIRKRGNIITPKAYASRPVLDNSSPWRLGQKVRHEKFGDGTIINIEGSGDHLRLQVAFKGEGIKWLMAKLANLTALN